MKGVVEASSLQLRKGAAGDALIYQDRLWVYSKAKQLGLADLAKAAADAHADHYIDIGEAPRRPEVLAHHGSWSWSHYVRTKHSQWWVDNGLQEIAIDRMSNTNWSHGTLVSFGTLLASALNLIRQTPSSLLLGPY